MIVGITEGSDEDLQEVGWVMKTGSCGENTALAKLDSGKLGWRRVTMPAAECGLLRSGTIAGGCCDKPTRVFGEWLPAEGVEGESIDELVAEGDWSGRGIRPPGRLRGTSGIPVAVAPSVIR